MENTTTWGTWLAYAAIVVFLLFVLMVFARTMMLFGTLTLMPVARVVRLLARFLGRRGP